MSNPAKANTIAHEERKSPMRAMRKTVGCLWRGKFFNGTSYQVSENSIQIEIPAIVTNPPDDHTQVVVSFFLPHMGGVSVIGLISRLEKQKFDIKFLDLPLAQRRMIRKYVSLKSQEEML